jgi:Putative beta-barrel porin 2
MRIAFFLLPLFACPVLQAQDAIRPSLAGEASAEARRQSIDNIPYNLLAGPIRFRFSTTFGIEYNDNINLAEKHTEDDFIVRPQINVNALWPITQLNTLKFDLGIGYAFYIDHPGNDTDGVLIAPGSAIAFDVFVGDFRINFHDRMSLEQDPVSEIALSNVVDYGRFQNTAGVSVLWDLNKAVATFGYDHYNYVSTTSAFDYLNRNAEELSGSLYFTLTNTTGIGVESNAVFTYYDQHFLNDSTTFSIGVFAETQVTNYLKVRVAGGYQGIWFDSGGGVMDSKDLNDFYANILISHRVNSVLTHSVSAGHETQLGLNSNYILLNYVRYTASWNIIRNTLLSTEFFYEDADDSGGIFSEHAHRFGGALTLGYQLTQHVTLGARYQYTTKDSDQPLRGYDQNRVSLDGTYSF